MFHEASSLSLSGILPRPANRERPDETLLFSVTLFRFLRNGYFSANPYRARPPYYPGHNLCRTRDMKQSHDFPCVLVSRG
jgi:hypothetical protein